ncbi:MAG TPA: RIP metalloprotease RseP [Candidatus Omnitrophota bacterium]|nr:RIP metalloprotease RseP [Candidatus Omnitrophota bacterium]HPT06774.1 RIP metalloprotease RseP [Candidatus Omnitrophota bacterium]
MSLIVFLLVLGVLIVVHEFGHFIMAKNAGVRVEIFSFGFGKKLFSRKKQDTEYIVSAVPLGGYVKLAGDNLEEFSGKPYEFYSKPPFQRALIVFFGPLLNYVLGILLFWLIFSVGYPTLTAKVGSVIEGYGAQAAGIQAGDTIVAIDGTRIMYWDDLQKITQEKKNAQSVSLLLDRHGVPVTVLVSIKSQEMEDVLGKKKNVGLLGVTASDEIVLVKHGIIESSVLAVSKTWSLTTMTCEALWRMVTGKMSLKDSVTGPLGVFYITSKAAALGLIPLLHLMAVLSISLAIFNLLPLPILDGGHLFLLAVEKVRGRGLSKRSEQVLSQVGFSLMIALAVLVTLNDIVKLYGDKIAKLFVK